MVSHLVISAAQLPPIFQVLDEQYKRGHTVQGTRSYHVFVPMGIGSLSFKRTAEDEIAETHHFFIDSSSLEVSLNHYVVVK